MQRERGLRMLRAALDEDTATVEADLARRARLWVGLLAGLGLFLELAVIRWHAGLFPVLSFLKNTSMFSCFLGLGIGYALSRRRVALSLVPGLLALQFIALTLLHYYSDLAAMAPVVRTLSAFTALRSEGAGRLVEAYAFTLAVYIFNALMFVPLGQATGRVMRTLPTLTGYGANLLGSACGVVLFYGLSVVWLPPTAWVAVAAVILAVAVRRRPAAVVRVVAPAALLIAVVTLPFDLLDRSIYTPYQVISYGPRDANRLVLWTNHAFYQVIPDWDRTVAPDGTSDSIYDLPYHLIQPMPREVLIVGAGAGNDVAAAMRHEQVRRVDAVEIDPVIVALGRRHHPDHPYDDRRVTVHVTDARAFFKSAQESGAASAMRRYDLIVFGLLDAHSALTSFGSFRMDTFVYTREAFAEAARLLKPTGILYVTFGGVVYGDEPPWQLRKIHALVSEAIGRAPLMVALGDRWAFWIGGPNWAPDASRLPAGWVPVPAAAVSLDGLDLPTDDWPFLYVARRHFPSSYVLLIAVFVLVSGAMILVMLRPGRVGESGTGGQHRTPDTALSPQARHAVPRFPVSPDSPADPVRAGPVHFFFLGAAFMLVEAKGITELALTFGSTWQVVGAVIVGVLVVAYIGNGLVESGGTGRRRWVWYLFLIGALAGGYLMPGSLLGRWMGGGPAATLTHLLILVLPILFASVIFSTSFRDGPGVERVLSANLFGAICGGFAEYSAVALGYRNLYLIAIGLYVLSAAALLLRWRRVAADGAAPA